MFRLSELLDYNGITIQCHNIPDADTIASAFAVYTYLSENGKKPRIIYSGPLEITKTNLLLMITELSIPIEYDANPGHTETLVLTDCQYGERNVQRVTADTVFVIDHHTEFIQRNLPGVIRSYLGACATLVWDLLRLEGFDFTKYPNVSTALYYGLYTDTNNLEEIAYPLDRDARDSLKYDANVIKVLRNNNLTMSELNIAGQALMTYSASPDIRYAAFRAAPCDPNILGFISDLALQVSGIDVCVVYNEIQDGYKLSVRSCIREVMADEFARFITYGMGSGGGHVTKAGGFMNKEKIDDTPYGIERYLDDRAKGYFESFDVVYSTSHNLDLSAMKQYTKKKTPVGFVRTTDIFDEGTPLVIRTLEGDAYLDAAIDAYLMIGIVGEVYPIKKDKFEAAYEITDSDFVIEAEYQPTARNKLTGEIVGLMRHAESCTAKGDAYIMAMPLTRNTKVFTKWNTEGYYSGVPGDYIVVRADDENDVYLIRESVFERSYEPRKRKDPPPPESPRFFAEERKTPSLCNRKENP